MQSINLAEKLALFSTHWDPHVIADYNGNDIMVVKFKGAFPSTSTMTRMISSMCWKAKW